MKFMDNLIQEFLVDSYENHDQIAQELLAIKAEPTTATACLACFRLRGTPADERRDPSRRWSDQSAGG
jgi:hypothetical protein